MKALALIAGGAAQRNWHQIDRRTEEQPHQISEICHRLYYQTASKGDTEMFRTAFRSRCLLLTALLAFFFGNPPNSWAQKDGPFGVLIGSDPALLKDCSPLREPGHFHCSKLPRTHPDMEGYIIQSHPTTGVCFVKSVGKDITIGSSGIEVKSKADEIAEQISVVYGKDGRERINLNISRLWTAPDEWVMASLSKEAMYAHRWKFTGQKIINNVSIVIVAASVTSRSKGFVGAEFYGTNYDECTAAIKKDAARAF